MLDILTLDAHVTPLVIITPSRRISQQKKHQDSQIFFPSHEGISLEIFPNNRRSGTEKTLPQYELRVAMDMPRDAPQNIPHSVSFPIQTCRIAFRNDKENVEARETIMPNICDPKLASGRHSKTFSSLFSNHLDIWKSGFHTSAIFLGQKGVGKSCLIWDYPPVVVESGIGSLIRTDPSLHQEDCLGLAYWVILRAFEHVKKTVAPVLIPSSQRPRVSLSLWSVSPNGGAFDLLRGVAKRSSNNDTESIGNRKRAKSSDENGHPNSGSEFSFRPIQVGVDSVDDAVFLLQSTLKHFGALELDADSTECIMHNGKAFELVHVRPTANAEHIFFRVTISQWMACPTAASITAPRKSDAGSAHAGGFPLNSSSLKVALERFYDGLQSGEENAMRSMRSSSIDFDEASMDGHSSHSREDRNRYSSFGNLSARLGSARSGRRGSISSFQSSTMGKRKEDKVSAEPQMILSPCGKFSLVHSTFTIVDTVGHQSHDCGEYSGEEIRKELGKIPHLYYSRTLKEYRKNALLNDNERAASNLSVNKSLTSAESRIKCFACYNEQRARSDTPYDASGCYSHLRDLIEAAAISSGANRCSSFGEFDTPMKRVAQQERTDKNTFAESSLCRAIAPYLSDNFFTSVVGVISDDVRDTVSTVSILRLLTGRVHSSVQKSFSEPTMTIEKRREHELLSRIAGVQPLRLKALRADVIPLFPKLFFDFLVSITPSRSVRFAKWLSAVEGKFMSPPFNAQSADSRSKSMSPNGIAIHPLDVPARESRRAASSRVSLRSTSPSAANQPSIPPLQDLPSSTLQNSMRAPMVSQMSRFPLEHVHDNYLHERMEPQVVSDAYPTEFVSASSMDVHIPSGVMELHDHVPSSFSRTYYKTLQDNPLKRMYCNMEEQHEYHGSSFDPSSLSTPHRIAGSICPPHRLRLQATNEHIHSSTSPSVTRAISPRYGMTTTASRQAWVQQSHVRSRSPVLPDLRATSRVPPAQPSSPPRVESASLDARHSLYQSQSASLPSIKTTLMLQPSSNSQSHLHVTSHLYQDHSSQLYHPIETPHSIPILSASSYSASSTRDALIHSQLHKTHAYGGVSPKAPILNEQIRSRSVPKYEDPHFVHSMATSQSAYVKSPSKRLSLSMLNADSPGGKGKESYSPASLAHTTLPTSSPNHESELTRVLSTAFVRRNLHESVSSSSDSDSDVSLPDDDEDFALRENADLANFPIPGAVSKRSPMIAPYIASPTFDAIEPRVQLVELPSPMSNPNLDFSYSTSVDELSHSPKGVMNESYISDSEDSSILGALTPIDHEDTSLLGKMDVEPESLSPMIVDNPTDSAPIESVGKLTFQNEMVRMEEKQPVENMTPQQPATLPVEKKPEAKSEANASEDGPEQQGKDLGGRIQSRQIYSPPRNLQNLLETHPKQRAGVVSHSSEERNAPNPSISQSLPPIHRLPLNYDLLGRAPPSPRSSPNFSEPISQMGLHQAYQQQNMVNQLALSRNPRDLEGQQSLMEARNQSHSESNERTKRIEPPNSLNDQSQLASKKELSNDLEISPLQGCIVKTINQSSHKTKMEVEDSLGISLSEGAQAMLKNLNNQLVLPSKTLNHLKILTLPSLLEDGSEETKNPPKTMVNNVQVLIPSLVPPSKGTEYYYSKKWYKASDDEDPSLCNFPVPALQDLIHDQDPTLPDPLFSNFLTTTVYWMHNRPQEEAPDSSSSDQDVSYEEFEAFDPSAADEPFVSTDLGNSHYSFYEERINTGMTSSESVSVPYASSASNDTNAQQQNQSQDLEPRVMNTPFRNEYEAPDSLDPSHPDSFVMSSVPTYNDTLNENNVATSAPDSSLFAEADYEQDFEFDIEEESELESENGVKDEGETELSLERADEISRQEVAPVSHSDAIDRGGDNAPSYTQLDSASHNEEAIQNDINSRRRIREALSLPSGDRFAADPENTINEQWRRVLMRQPGPHNTQPHVSYDKLSRQWDEHQETKKLYGHERREFPIEEESSSGEENYPDISLPVPAQTLGRKRPNLLGMPINSDGWNDMVAEDVELPEEMLDDIALIARRNVLRRKLRENRSSLRSSILNTLSTKCEEAAHADDHISTPEGPIRTTTKKRAQQDSPLTPQPAAFPESDESSPEGAFGAQEYMTGAPSDVVVSVTWQRIHNYALEHSPTDGVLSPMSYQFPSPITEEDDYSSAESIRTISSVERQQIREWKRAMREKQTKDVASNLTFSADANGAPSSPLLEAPSPINIPSPPAPSTPFSPPLQVHELASTPGEREVAVEHLPETHVKEVTGVAAAIPQDAMKPQFPMNASPPPSSPSIPQNTLTSSFAQWRDGNQDLAPFDPVATQTTFQTGRSSPISPVGIDFGSHLPFTSDSPLSSHSQQEAVVGSKFSTPSRASSVPSDAASTRTPISQKPPRTPVSQKLSFYSPTPQSRTSGATTPASASTVEEEVYEDEFEQYESFEEEGEMGRPVLDRAGSFASTPRSTRSAQDSQTQPGLFTPPPLTDLATGKSSEGTDAVPKSAQRSPRSLIMSEASPFYRGPKSFQGPLPFNTPPASIISPIPDGENIFGTHGSLLPNMDGFRSPWMNPPPSLQRKFTAPHLSLDGGEVEDEDDAEGSDSRRRKLGASDGVSHDESGDVGDRRREEAKGVGEGNEERDDEGDVEGEGQGGSDKYGLRSRSMRSPSGGSISPLSDSMEGMERFISPLSDPSATDAFLGSPFGVHPQGAGSASVAVGDQGAAAAGTGWGVGEGGIPEYSDVISPSGLDIDDLVARTIRTSAQLSAETVLSSVKVIQKTVSEAAAESVASSVSTVLSAVKSGFDLEPDVLPLPSLPQASPGVSRVVSPRPVEAKQSRLDLVSEFDTLSKQEGAPSGASEAPLEPMTPEMEPLDNSASRSTPASELLAKNPPLDSRSRTTRSAPPEHTLLHTPAHSLGLSHRLPLLNQAGDVFPYPSPASLARPSDAYVSPNLATQLQPTTYSYSSPSTRTLLFGTPKAKISPRLELAGVSAGRIASAVAAVETGYGSALHETTILRASGIFSPSGTLSRSRRNSISDPISTFDFASRFISPYAASLRAKSAPASPQLNSVRQELFPDNTLQGTLATSFSPFVGVASSTSPLLTTQASLLHSEFPFTGSVPMRQFGRVRSPKRTEHRTHAPVEHPTAHTSPSTVHPSMYPPLTRTPSLSASLLRSPQPIRSPNLTSSQLSLRDITRTRLEEYFARTLSPGSSPRSRRASLPPPHSPSMAPLLHRLSRSVSPTKSPVEVPDTHEVPVTDLPILAPPTSANAPDTIPSSPLARAYSFTRRDVSNIDQTRSFADSSTVSNIQCGAKMENAEPRLPPAINRYNSVQDPLPSGKIPTPGASIEPLASLRAVLTGDTALPGTRRLKSSPAKPPALDHFQLHRTTMPISMLDLQSLQSEQFSSQSGAKATNTGRNEGLLEVPRLAKPLEELRDQSALSSNDLEFLPHEAPSIYLNKLGTTPDDAQSGEISPITFRDEFPVDDLNVTSIPGHSINMIEPLDPSYSDSLIRLTRSRISSENSIDALKSKSELSRMDLTQSIGTSLRLYRAELQSRILSPPRPRWNATPQFVDVPELMNTWKTIQARKATTMDVDGTIHGISHQGQVDLTVPVLSPEHQLVVPPSEESAPQVPLIEPALLPSDNNFPKIPNAFRQTMLQLKEEEHRLSSRSKEKQPVSRMRRSPHRKGSNSSLTGEKAFGNALVEAAPLLMNIQTSKWRESHDRLLHGPADPILANRSAASASKLPAAVDLRDTQLVGRGLGRSSNSMFGEELDHSRPVRRVDEDKRHEKFPTTFAAMYNAVLGSNY